jgi:hypothetical protein
LRSGAYHGSPHDFDRFDMNRIGTGEGAQVFGHGLYFTDRKDLAEHYIKVTTGVPSRFLKPIAVVDGVEYDEAISEVIVTVLGKTFLRSDDGSLVDNKTFFVDADDAAKAKKEWTALRARITGDLDPRTVKYFESGIAFLDAAAGKNVTIRHDEPKGRLYEVEIDVDQDRLLHWDKPPHKQSKFVRDAISKVDIGVGFMGALRRALNRTPLERGAFVSSTSHIGAYIKSVGDQEKLAQNLRSQGVQGVAYLDRASRWSGEGTYNYVVFDDSLIRIVAKDGKPVAPDERSDVVGSTVATDQPMFALRDPELPEGISTRSYTSQPLVSGFPTMREGPMFAIRAYHGSPHDFDRFNMGRIGTGEGAQAFGYGLYFAENERVARYYQETLPTRADNPTTGRLYEVMIDADDSQMGLLDVGIDEQPPVVRAFLESRMVSQAEFEAARDAFSKTLWIPRKRSDAELVMTAEEKIQSVMRSHERNLVRELNRAIFKDDGHAHTLAKGQRRQNVFEIVTDPAHAEAVESFPRLARAAQAFRNDIGPAQTFHQAYYAKTNISRLLRPMTPDEAHDLRRAGIKGVKYLDGLSRSDGSGTHNYVIFDDSLIKITAKDGKPVTPDERADVIGSTVARDQPMFTFAGERAQTADLDALARAKDMAEAGATREAIWQDTGWFKGVDGKWRWEIDDGGLTLPYSQVGKAFKGPIRRLFDHPDLESAYPSIMARRGKLTLDPKMKDGSGIAFKDGFISVSAPDASTARPVALHELQHQIQAREQFSNGVGAWPMRPTAADWERYRLTAGEVEARAVEARMNMTPEERRRIPPWESYDVPESDQIVRDQVMFALAQRDTLSPEDKVVNIEAVQSRMEQMEKSRSSINDTFDVVVQPGLIATYFVVPKGKDAYSKRGTPQHVGSFVVKPAQRNVPGVEVTNASIAQSYRRQGLATAVYDRIAEDFADVGGLSPSPADQMSPDARAFWRSRLPSDQVMFALSQDIEPVTLGLDMSKEARMERAKAMGFDPARSDSPNPMFAFANDNQTDYTPLVRSYADAYQSVLGAAAERGITQDSLPAIMQALADDAGGLSERLADARDAIESILGPEATDSVIKAITDTLPYLPDDPGRIDADTIMAAVQRAMDEIATAQETEPGRVAANDNAPDTPLVADMEEVQFLEDMAMMIGACKA